MIILDTNVLSAIMKVQPDPIIIRWLDEYDLEYLWLTSITVMEIQYGIALLPNGKKRNLLQQAFNDLLLQRFRTRIIEFDENAAIATAHIAANRKKVGMNQDIRDLQIAGITLHIGAELATRNHKDFKGMEIKVINPWE